MIQSFLIRTNRRQVRQKVRTREALLYGGSIDPGRTVLALVGPFVVLILGGMLFNAVKPKIPDYI